jgi:serine/threonine protein kinase
MSADPAGELTPEQWQRLQALFADSCDLPASQRDAFIARADGSDGLRRHLAGMLASDTDARVRLARVIEEAARMAAPAERWSGRRFGAYRAVREIGRGGMGVVLEAVRDDVHKRVAVKIAPWASNVALIRERFRLEGQILAALEHPNIARFLDAGTEDDVPFVVMEYVEGVPITEYCATRQLGVRERLDLFRRVCAAVHVAHERLIVHRDLKPANILVDDSGVPKLLDFGIAKLLNPVTAGDVTAGVAMWTPDYSSPEQVRNGPITVRTDVYSLGLILYELLTGTRAQVADSSSALALDRSICETEPMRPSEHAAAAGDGARARRLRGDLDLVVMTAIRKEPEQRYASAAALSDDIGRYLDGRPLLARPSSALYRARKLVRRHRVAAIAALLLIATGVTGITATVYQARRAERRFQQVRSLANAVVFDLHDRIATIPGSTQARQVLVQTALTYLENLKDDATGDATLSAELAAAYLKIASVQGSPLEANLGDMRGAIASFARAEALLEPLAQKGDAEARLRLATAAHERGLVHLALGDARAAKAAYDRSLERVEPLLTLQPDHAAPLSLMVGVYADLTQVAGDQRDLASAGAAAARAVQMAQRLVALDPANREHRHHLASGHATLARVAANAGRIEEAAANFRVANDIREQLLREEPASLDYRRSLLVGYGNYGDVLGARLGANLGDTYGAEKAFARAVEIAESIRDQDPVDRRAVFDLASVKLRLGTLLTAEPDRVAEGLRHLEESARLNAGLLAQEPASNRYGYFGLVLDRRMGDALVMLGRRTEGARLLEKVRSDAPRMLKGPNGPNARVQLVLATLSLAAVHADAGDSRAGGLATFAMTELSEKPLDVPEIDAGAYATLGRTYLALATRSRTGEREDLLERAAASLEKSIALWQQAKLSPALEARRTNELAKLAGDLAASRRGRFRP